MRKFIYIYLLLIAGMLMGCSEKADNDESRISEELSSDVYRMHMTGIITDIKDHTIVIVSEEDGKEYQVEYVWSIKPYDTGDRIRFYYFPGDEESEDNTIRISDKRDLLLYDE